MPDSLLDFSEQLIKGAIIASFTIDTSGTIQDIKLIQGLHPVLDSEWIRVLKMMPKWTPGMQNGKAVKTTLKLPVTVVIPAD